MATGIHPVDDIKKKYDEMKLRHNIKYMIFKINDDKTNIIIEHVEDGKMSDDIAAAKETFSSFAEKLPDGDCRYAVINMPVQSKKTADTIQHKLVLLSWSDDNGPVKKKMVYASSKNTLKNQLDGLSLECQATCREELDYDEIASKCL